MLPEKVPQAQGKAAALYLLQRWCLPGPGDGHPAGSGREMQPEQPQGIDNSVPKHPQMSLGGFRAILMKPVTS